MDNIKYAIIDDEPDASELLRLCIKELFPLLNEYGIYSNWRDAYQAIFTGNIDLIFMDISMPEKNGLELLKLLPNINSEIVFTTAHAEYALDAFQFSPAGYLLKPVVDEELLNVTTKTLERIRHKKAATLSTINVNGKIGIFNNKGIDYIPLSTIIYLESANKCAKIVTAQNEYISSHYLGRFKTMLNNTFYQVHRSYIVNLNEVVRYESGGLAIMSNNKNIPIARNLKDEFLKQLGTFVYGRDQLK